MAFTIHTPFDREYEMPVSHSDRARPTVRKELVIHLPGVALLDTLSACRLTLWFALPDQVPLIVLHLRFAVRPR